MRTEILAFLNLKGGTGKTTTVLNIASALAADGQRVLVIDLDPQANATQALAPTFDDQQSLGVNDVLASSTEGGIAAAIHPTEWDGVDLVPSSIALANRERDGGPASAVRLRRGLRGVDGYDQILIDCNPSIGQLTSNALTSATRAVIVTELSRASLRGVHETLANIAEAQELQPLQTVSIVANRYDARSSEETYRLEELRQAYPDLLCEPVIPSRAVVKTAYGAGAPVQSVSGKPATDLTHLYAELATRLLEGPRA